MKAMSLISPTLQSPQREKYILHSKLFRGLSSYIVWLKKQLGRSKRGVGDDGVGELVKPRKAQLVTVAFPSVIAIQEVRMC